MKKAAFLTLGCRVNQYETECVREELLAAGFTDTFRFLHPTEEKYSWWSYMFHAREKNVGWRIDYFIISNRLCDKLLSADIHNEVMGSDHCPVEAVIDL